MPDPSRSFEDALEQSLAERELRQVLSGFQEVPGTPVRTGGSIPAVSGLRLSAAGGTIEVTWNDVPSGDLVRYDVQVALSPSFSGAETFQVGPSTTRFTHQPGDTETRWIRVRAVTRSGEGPFDLVLNTTTGASVSTLTLALASATVLGTYNQDGGFVSMDLNPPINTTVSASDLFGPAVVSVPDLNTAVEPMIYMEYQVATSWGSASTAAAALNIRFELLRRPQGGAADEVLGDAIIDVFSTLGDVAEPQLARSVAPTFAPLDFPGAGTWEYRLRVIGTVTEGGTDFGLRLRFQASLVRMQFKGIKR